MKLLCWPFSRYNVTARLDCAFTGKSIGSDTTRAPFGIVMDVFPLNVTCLIVCGSMALAPAAPPSRNCNSNCCYGKIIEAKRIGDTQPNCAGTDGRMDRLANCGVKET